MKLVDLQHKLQSGDPSPKISHSTAQLCFWKVINKSVPFIDRIEECEGYYKIKECVLANKITQDCNKSDPENPEQSEINIAGCKLII